jgi:hypothetical protein
MPALGLVWLTTWDSEKDAQEFAVAYDRVQEKRLADSEAGGAIDIRKEPKAEASDPFRGRRESSTAIYHIERRGSDVAVIEGFSSAATDELLKAAFARIISPKSYPTPEPFDAP